ncbi:pentatricopeptide repeat-containing protein 5, mitochondrial [Ceratobasidium sp. AG-Ba]|nr:pentatricopeptide repeat-containing protein 5, mitochondrial [Ceratobasidium sp. AG-Ba]
MIPKLATNLLHIQRAAAAVQNGASSTLRNLQLQSANSGSLNWAGAGSSSSGWSSTGGAKYNAGSKFYQGYTGPGRAITHANAEQHDELDDPRAITLHPRRARTLTPRDRRARAASLAPSPSDLRVLKTILAARAARPDAVRHNSTVARELPSELDLATTATTATSKPDSVSPPMRTGLRKRSKSMSALPEMRLRAADSEPPEETVDRNMRDWESYQTLNSTNDHAAIRREIHRVRTEVYPFENRRRKRNKGGVFRGLAALLPLSTFSRLLRACATRGERGGAVRVWEVLERRGAAEHLEKGQYTPAVFRHLIATYASARDIDGAEEVFNEWLKFVAEGRIIGIGSAPVSSWTNTRPDRNPSAPVEDGEEGVTATTGTDCDVWDEMVVAYAMCGNGSKAVEMVEMMMDGQKGAPKPTGATFSRMIRAFCDSGDVKTAYAWFERLRSMGGAYTPNTYAWAHILTGLGTSGRARVVVEANAAAIERGAAHVRAATEGSEDEVALAIEADEFARKMVLPHLPSLSEAHQIRILRDLTLRLGRAAAEIAALRLAASGVFAKSPESSELAAEQNMAVVSRATTSTIDELIRALYAARQLTLDQHIRAARAWCNVTSGLPHELPARGIVDTLASAQEGLSSAEWELVSNAFAIVLANEGPVTDAALAAFSRAPLDSVNWRDVVRGAIPALGYERTREAMGAMGQEVLEFIDTFGPKAESPVESAASSPQSPATAYTSAAEEAPFKPQENSPAMHIDPLQSKFIDEYTLPRSSVTPLDAFARFLAGMHIGRLPAPETIGRLINALGRQGAVDKVQFLYSAGQQALACLEHDKAWQAQAWFQLEDQMVVALAHAERPEAAAVHKARIIAQGGAPSADAYGALIAGVKNTTDDAQVARELFEEARKLGVPANIFLYNTVISKAARARKAEYALELFHEMRAAGLRPTSVTYGAIIGACCRVGDAETASYLFAEMSSMPNFRPRVPPYNTMMQFFVATKPNRERCLDYYQAMLDARVAPSAHTYKLLLDCYGSIEPVDLASMEDVFKRLQQDRHVAVQGAHWAALINAYGCSAHNLEQALATFERIPAHAQPDAVAFEALFNVIVSNHRVDLVPVYLERMANVGVHMTAYIGNLLIKGYASAGQLERARGVFESMSDPPVGLAAVHNHPGHSHVHGSEGDMLVPVGAPVYREPSTWEAMVRAELGAGEKERAARLLDRMEDRMFPVAVTSRIRSIMGEDGSLVEPPQPVSP